MKMPYHEFGNGIKTILLLHAFPLSRKMWEPNIESILETDCRVITPDFRGFGENKNFADINLMEDLANDVAELFETLDTENAIIAGLSMGGYVAFNLFRLHPRKFSALILCDTTCEADTEEKKQGRFDLAEKIDKQGSPALVENTLPNLISDFTKENNPELVADLEVEFSKCEPQGAIAALLGMAERIDHTHILEKIDVPTLLVFGEDDKITNLEAAEKLHKNIENSDLKIIKNAGHYSNLENPEHFNSVFINFINGLEQ